MDIQRKARRVIRHSGTNDPFKICKAYHVILKFLPLGSIYGFHQYVLHQHIIYINQDLSDEWQRFTCAHELGHVFFHQDINTKWIKKYTAFSVDKIEHQADDFAIALLTYGFEPEEGMTIYDAAEICGIPKAYADRIPTRPHK